MSKVINDLYDYVPLKIYQNEDYFKFSLDSVLLAEFVKKPETKKSILDLCAGNAAVSMILSTKTNANIVCVEYQHDIVDLANESIKYNGLENQIKVVEADVLDLGKYFPGNNFDVVVCNPPYFTINEFSQVNDNSIKAIARHEIKINLEQIIDVSSRILQLKGEFYMIHRAERIDEIICYCSKYNLNVKNIQFITTKENEAPRMVLIRAVKGSEHNVKIGSFINISNYNSFKNIFWR